MAMKEKYDDANSIAVCEKGPLPDSKEKDLQRKLVQELESIVDFASLFIKELTIDGGVFAENPKALPAVIASPERPYVPFTCTWGDIRRWKAEEKRHSETRTDEDARVGHPHRMDDTFDEADDPSHKDDDIAYSSWSPELGDYNAKTNTITIYYRNHPGYLDDDPLDSKFNKYFLANVFMTLAHEYGHHLHRLYLGLPAFFTVDDYWTYVVEPIADYFAYVYMSHGPNDYLKYERRSAARGHLREWCQYFGSPWPYAYALTFCLESWDEIKYLFAYRESKRGWLPAFDLIMDKVKYKPRVIPVAGTPSPIPDVDKQIWDDAFERLKGAKGPSCFLVQEDWKWGKKTAVPYLFAPDDDVWHHKIMKAVKKGDYVVHVVHFVEDYMVAGVSIAKTDCQIGINSMGDEGLLVEIRELLILGHYCLIEDKWSWAKMENAKIPFSAFDEKGDLKTAYLSCLNSYVWKEILDVFKRYPDTLTCLFDEKGENA